MATYSSTWRGIDRGRENWLIPDHWMRMIEVLAQNEGELIRDPSSSLYKDLANLDASTVWISEHDPDHNFFRDYQTPWTLTGVLKPTRETQGQIVLTELGRLLAARKVSQRAVMIQAMAEYEEESGEHSYAIIADAFLRQTQATLTLRQVYHCIVTGWRPDDANLTIIDDSDCPDIADATVKRRLRSILALMTLYGALQSDGATWSIGDEQLLEAIAHGKLFPAPTIHAVPAKMGPTEDVISHIDEEVENAILASTRTDSDSQVKRVLREIAARRGQSKFRKQLLGLYGAACAITHWDSEITLEAAHIVPVAKNGTSDVTNGILLRADIHTLFDLHCLSIDPECWEVRMAPFMQKTKYSELQGSPVNLPASLADYPSRKRLHEHLLSLRNAV